MKNVLFVSIAFPPKNNPECLQTAKYFKYLSRQKDLTIDVVTSELPTLFMPEDISLRKYLKDFRQMVTIPVYENKYISFLLRKINTTWLELPDSKFTFYMQAGKAIKQLQNRPDVIYSRSFPLSSTLMAMKLQEHFQVPWVLHLSDPWADNPLDQRTSAAKVRNAIWEKKCFKQASYITLTSDKTVAFYKKKYPQWKHKFEMMPNVYDLEDMEDTVKDLVVAERRKLRFVYTGGLTDNRTPEPFFKALQLLERDNPELLNEIEFLFAGQFDRKNNAIFEQYTLSCVKNLGLFSYEEARQLQLQADVLLIIDSPARSEEEALFFPSKILDYILAQKRIMGITDENSTTYNVIHNQYGECFAHKDITIIAAAIKQYLTEYKAGNMLYFKNQLKDNTFAADHNAGRLYKLIKSL